MRETTLPLVVRRNCNLDVCLLPAAGLPPITDSGNNSKTNGSTGSPQQKLTIFYDGHVYVYDVTELQAKAIIWLARQEMGERMNTPLSEPVSPSLHSQFRSPTGLSMKRSLQCFLQKRKSRIQATSPYKQ